MQFATVCIEHLKAQRDTLAAHACDGADDAHQVTCLCFVNEVGGSPRRDRMHAVRVQQFIEGKAGNGIHVKHCIIEEVCVPPHVHVTELIVMPRVDDAAHDFVPIIFQVSLLRWGNSGRSGIVSTSRALGEPNLNSKI